MTVYYIYTSSPATFIHVSTIIQKVGSTNPRLDFSHETESILLYMQPAARIFLSFSHLIIVSLQ
jgi:hypothetical protein